MFQKHIRVHAHTRTRVCITSYNSSGDDKNTIHAYNNLSIMKMIVDVKMASSSRRENLAKEKERFELQMSGIYMYTKGYTKPWPRNYDKLRKGEGGRFNYTTQQVVERGENVETSINTTETDRCPASWSKSAWPPVPKTSPEAVSCTRGTCAMSPDSVYRIGEWRSIDARNAVQVG